MVRANSRVSQPRLIVLLATFVVACLLFASVQVHNTIKNASVALWLPTTMTANSTGVSAMLEDAYSTLAMRIRNIRQRQRDFDPHVTAKSAANDTGASVMTHAPQRRVVVRNTRIPRSKRKKWSYVLTCSNGIKINCTYPPLSTR